MLAIEQFPSFKLQMSTQFRSFRHRARLGLLQESSNIHLRESRRFSELQNLQLRPTSFRKCRNSMETSHAAAQVSTAEAIGCRPNPTAYLVTYGVRTIWEWLLLRQQKCQMRASQSLFRGLLHRLQMEFVLESSLDCASIRVLRPRLMSQSTLGDMF